MADFTTVIVTVAAARGGAAFQELVTTNGEGQVNGGKSEVPNHFRLLKQTQDKDMEPLIQGGKIAKRGRFPYATMIMDRMDNQACGGALVHESWVVTAAHCLDITSGRVLDGDPVGLNPQMIIGALFVSDREGTTKNVQVDVGEALLHPDWNGIIGDGNDIALVKLSKPSDLKPIKMAASGSEFIDGHGLLAMGWGSQGPGKGRSDRLRWGELLYRDNENCNEFFWNGLVLPTMMCATPRSKADVCRGDSGGPLISPHFPKGNIHKGKPGSDLLVGLVSFGDSKQCESTGVDGRKPAVFTRISEFKEWIDEVIAIGNVPNVAVEPDVVSKPPVPQQPGQEELDEELWKAALDGRLDAVKEAVAAGANIEHKDGSTDATPLVIASGKNHVSIVQYLIEEGADVNARDKSGDTALIDASYTCENPDLVDTLIDAGAEVNVQDDFGKTALIEAAINGHVECVEILIDAGADMNIQDIFETSALMEAARECLPEVAEALVKAGASKKLKKGTDKAKDLIDCGLGNNGATKKLKKILG